jgi:hypothetical protein
MGMGTARPSSGKRVIPTEAPRGEGLHNPPPPGHLAQSGVALTTQTSPLKFVLKIGESQSTVRLWIGPFIHVSALLLVRTLPPFCEGLDGAEKYQAEPEVHQDA